MCLWALSYVQCSRHQLQMMQIRLRMHVFTSCLGESATRSTCTLGTFASMWEGARVQRQEPDELYDGHQKVEASHFTRAGRAGPVGYLTDCMTIGCVISVFYSEMLICLFDRRKTQHRTKTGRPFRPWLWWTVALERPVLMCCATWMAQRPSGTRMALPGEHALKWPTRRTLIVRRTRCVWPYCASGGDL